MRILSFTLLFLMLLTAAAFAQSPTDSLKFRYDLGTNYNDLGPTANHLQKASGATHTFAASGDARVLNCIEMNDSGGAASTSAASNQGWSQMAISVWIYVQPGSKGSSNGGMVLDGNQLGFGLSAFDDGNGTPSYSVYFDGTASGSISASGVASGAWHHVLAQNDGNNTSIYLDGQLASTGAEILYPTTVGNPSPSVIYVGQLANGNNPFDGKLSTLKIYNRILTSTEILTLAGVALPKRIYVNWSASGSNDGTSWANAYAEFHSALNEANEHDTIWVATGGYFPIADTTGDMNPMDVSQKSFLWNKNLHIYGGFNGAETSLSQRPAGVKTNLSGDLAGPTNAKTVIFAKHLDASSLIDGFVFEQGVGQTYAGGMYCTYDKMFTIQNCEFPDNQAYRGSGLFASGNCHIVVKNSTFHDNTTYQSGDHAGAGVHGLSSNFFFQNCSFYNNSAKYGSAVELEGNATSPGLDYTVFANCLFHDNQAGFWGSPAIYGYGVLTGVRLYNCTFANNSTESTQTTVSDAIGMNGGFYTAINSIFWSNSDRILLYDPTNNPASTFTLENCIVKGGYSGTGSNNLSTYPAFADSAANDFRLTGNSVALNAGKADTTGMLKWLGMKDLDGNNRLFGTTMDIGCYEFQANVATDPARTTAIRLYPNPATNLLTVEMPTPAPMTVRDLTGKTLMTATASGTTTLDISGLPAGMYLLQASQHGTTSFIKK